MRFTLLIVALASAVAGCRGARRELAPVGVVRSRADTVDVLEAFWRTPASIYTGVGVRWLYLPNDDSVAFTASEAVREALIQRGVPASTRQPAGHDTVVFRVRRWTSDSMGVPHLEVNSEWTRVSRGVPDICMTGGNEETYRVRKTGAGWEAERVGRGLHGNGYCRSESRQP